MDAVGGVKRECQCKGFLVNVAWDGFVVCRYSTGVVFLFFFFFSFLLFAPAEYAINLLYFLSCFFRLPPLIFSFSPFPSLPVILCFPIQCSFDIFRNGVSPERRRNRAADARGVSKTTSERGSESPGRVKRRSRERRRMRNVMGGGTRKEEREGRDLIFLRPF